MPGQAWFLDCDTLWLRQPSLAKSVQGHLFASMGAAHGAMVRGPEAQRIQRWQIEYLTKPREEVFLATPFRFPARSPFLQDAIADLRIAVDRAKPLAYTYFMQLSVFRLHFRAYGCSKLYLIFDLSDFAILCVRLFIWVYMRACCFFTRCFSGRLGLETRSTRMCPTACLILPLALSGRPTRSVFNRRQGQGTAGKNYFRVHCCEFFLVIQQRRQVTK